MKSNAKGQRLGPMPPEQYDFANWVQFFQDTLRYHLAKYPDYPERDLVVDRIKTFRQFMSPRVVKHLGALVRYHPRYEDVDGWGQWSQAVQIRLHSRDSTITTAQTPTPEASIQNYKSGGCTAEALWDALDQFVVTDVLKSHKQRELFWDALAHDTRLRLVQESSYFDPAHSVWTENGLGPVSDLEAEQEIAQIMNLRWGAQRQAQRTADIRLTLTWFILSLLGAAVTLLAFAPRNDGMLRVKVVPRPQWYELDFEQCRVVVLTALVCASTAASAYRLFGLLFAE